MAVRDDRSDVKQTTTGFRGPLMVQSLKGWQEWCETDNDRVSRAADGAIPHLC